MRDPIRAFTAKLPPYTAAIGIFVCLLGAAMWYVSQRFKIEILTDASPSAVNPAVVSPAAELDPYANPMILNGVVGLSNEALVEVSEFSDTSQRDLAVRPVVTEDNLRGGLRIRNQSLQPLRVVLLGKQTPLVSDLGDANAAANLAAAEAFYYQPVHWDFAPDEGSVDGLLLSLPEGDLTLQVGDIIIAFSQDGSRSYWGPFVVGASPLPVWNAEQAEWQLLLDSQILQ